MEEECHNTTTAKNAGPSNFEASLRMMSFVRNIYLYQQSQAQAYEYRITAHSTPYLTYMYGQEYSYVRLNEAKPRAGG